MKTWWKKNGLFVFTLFALVVILVPLFAISHYNYPTSDDFSYGDSVYRNVKAGNDLGVIIRGAFEEAVRFYQTWQGRYFDDLVSAFGVGIAIPQFYFLGTYLVLTVFVAGSLGSIFYLLRTGLDFSKGLAMGLAGLVTGMQILYVPYPSEAFYWYVGATGYTLTFALVELLFLCIYRFYAREKGKNRIGSAIGAVLLVVMVGGSNYATALLTAEILVILLVLRLVLKKSSIFLGFLFVEYILCFGMNALSPGNQSRMNNVEGLTPFESILESLKQGGVFIREWFHVPVLLFCILCLIIACVALADSGYNFRMPGLFTGLTYGLFASILTPPLYAGATWGPGRLINVMYFSYYLFLAGNIVYWTGWCYNRYPGVRKAIQKRKEDKRFRYFLPGVVGIYCLLLLGCIKFYGVNSINAGSAFLSLVKGEAAQYRLENERRWELYENPVLEEVEVEAFSVHPYVLYHDDIQTDSSDWRNYVTAAFFGKKSVKVKE